MFCVEHDDERGTRLDVGDRRSSGRMARAPDTGNDTLRYHVQRAARAAFDVAGLHDDTVDRRGLASAVIPLGLSKVARPIPSHPQLLRRTHGVPFVRRNDADEITAAHDTRTRDVRNRVRVDARDASTVAVRPLAARTNDAPVPHAGHAHVLHVDVRARGLRRYVVARNADADDLVLANGLDGRVARER